MALIPQEEINELRMQVNIIDVISSYIPLSHKGKNYFGVCPFHEDHSPSMSVSEEKQIYKCFSCGAAGNVFTFVQNFENVSFIEALQIVAQKYGFPLSASVKQIKSDKNTKYYDILDITTKFYQNNLKTEFGKQAMQYLEKRGLNKEAILEFNIGLALNSNNSLTNFLKSKKYQNEDLDKVGLVSIKDNIANDYFVNRIMFPLEDSNGKIIGYSGRIYYESNAPKYLNTKETLLFKKGQMLFNYSRAKPYIRNEKKVILVEGYMDAIRLYLNGIKNVVAIMGTSLTKEQTSLLKKLNAKIILCLDNDAPGQKAIYEIGKELKNNNFEVEVIKLSNEKDPDEYVLKEGIKAFEKNLKNPLKYLDFSLNYLKQNKNLGQTVDLADYINAVLKDLEKETDEILIDLTLKKLVTDYNLDYDILKSKLKNLTQEQKVKEIKEEPKVKNKKNRYNMACEKILFYMMNEPKYVRMYQNNLVFLDNLNYREIAKEIIYYYETNKDINMADFVSFASSNERFFPDVLHIINESDDNLEENVFNDYLKKIKVKNKEKTIKELKVNLKEELDKNKKMEIAMKIAELKKGSV